MGGYLSWRWAMRDRNGTGKMGRKRFFFEKKAAKKLLLAFLAVLARPRSPGGIKSFLASLSAFSARGAGGAATRQNS
jgi:hypothetical protein